MTPRSRIPRESSDLFQSMEAHLYFLWEACERFREQPDRYKQIAAELRVLVCKTRVNHPLLLDLMDRYDFPYLVHPPGPPFDKQPIPLINDTAQTQFTNEVQDADFGDEAVSATLLEKQAALRRSLPFREYVDQGLAMFIAPHSYSYKELTLAIAQQLGSSHEDTEVDQSLVQSASLFLGGHPSHLAVLLNFANKVIQVGSKFLSFLHLNHGYSPKYFRFDLTPQQPSEYH